MVFGEYLVQNFVMSKYLCINIYIYPGRQRRNSSCDKRCKREKQKDRIKNFHYFNIFLHNIFALLKLYLILLN